MPAARTLERSSSSFIEATHRACRSSVSHGPDDGRAQVTITPGSHEPSACIDPGDEVRARIGCGTVEALIFKRVSKAKRGRFPAALSLSPQFHPPIAAGATI